MINWIDILACPWCLVELSWVDGLQDLKLECPRCERQYPIFGGIPIFSEPPFDRREYLFETKRYDKVALERPTEWGLDETHPQTRVDIFKSYLEDSSRYLNIGAGFGLLEEQLPDKEKFCLDQSLDFLRILQKEDLLNINFIKAFGEKMPIKSNLFPAVISDSVLQTVTDQREFLIECCRVLEPGGLFLLATTYKWNYPRKPQEFPASNGRLLQKFLHEYGVEVSTRYINLSRPEERVIYEGGDYFLAYGHKRRGSLEWEP